MPRILIPILLLYTQVYLVLNGYKHLGKLATPFAILLISGLIAINSFHALMKQKGHKQLKLNNAAIGICVGLLSIIVCYPSLRSIFDQWDYVTGTDVVLIMETMFDRFKNGLQPYHSVEQYPWHPFPIYMPLYWLPTGLSKLLGCDVRWIGILLLAVGLAIWGIVVWARDNYLPKKVITIALPSFVLWSYIYWDPTSLGLSLESIVVCYYLILAAGLVSRNLTLTCIGIITCLLSRFTMIFWLPFFLFLLWQNVPKNKSFIVWAVIGASIFFIYLLPFHFRDPSILEKGLVYHNHCYVDMWNGLGHPEQATIFDNGLTFSWYVRAFTSGPMQDRVQVGRAIQASIMILVLIVGYIGYRQWKEKIHFYDYSLAMLYIMLMTFFLFSPASFHYYYMPVLIVSSVLSARTILIKYKVDKHG